MASNSCVFTYIFRELLVLKISKTLYNAYFLIWSIFHPNRGVSWVVFGVSWVWFGVNGMGFGVSCPMLWCQLYSGWCHLSNYPPFTE